MADLENRIFCRLDGLTPAAREEKRLAALRKLGLLTAETLAVFEEATQTAARFLDAPICILGIMTQDQLQLKSAVGLSRVGLMNQLAQLRQLPRSECFCTYVVDTHQVLVIDDTVTNSVFAKSLLVGQYGIRSYLGAPLLTTDGLCLGTLAVMDLVPRCFTHKDSEFLAITARWSLSEYERNHLLKQESTSSVHCLPPSSEVAHRGVVSPKPRRSAPQAWESDSATPTTQNLSKSRDVSKGLSADSTSTNSIKVKLLTQLTQELRTPLTSVMGMASVLSRQVYGSLTSKQKEYIEIIHRSGQHLVSLVEEIVALGLLDETSEKIHLTSVDIEMLCQQAINNLSEIAQQRQQQIRLSIEPGNRIWLLDKDKVRQMVYYLTFSVISSAEAGGEVRIHVCRKSNIEALPGTSLNISVWVSHPWLGDGLPPVYGGITESLLTSSSAAAAVSDSLETPLGKGRFEGSELTSISYLPLANQVLSSASLWETLRLNRESNKQPRTNDSRESLGLLLSCHLAELHRGKLSVQGSSDLGYRYVISLPQLESADEAL